VRAVPAFKVLSPGLSTTIQDLGRRGCLEFGIPTGGAADEYSHRLANAVAGNEPGAATLEMTLLGAKLEALERSVIAVAGADMGFRLNGSAAPLGRRVELDAGDVIAFTKATHGCVTYIAVHGGFDGTVALGSRSTYIAGRLGGHFGRALKQGDVLRTLDGEPAHEWRPDDGVMGWPLAHETLRVVRGPQSEYFTDAAYRAFVIDDYTVSPRSNRVAYRLTGRAPEVAAIPRTADTGSGPTDIIEDGNAVGVIQIAGGVEPICMARDCPTSGAYAKIATIVTPDVSRMAQMKPGDTFRFAEVSVDEAFDIALEVAAAMDAFGLAT